MVAPPQDRDLELLFYWPLQISDLPAFFSNTSSNFASGDQPPFSANDACGVSFLDLSVALGDLPSRGLKTPFPRPLAAGFLSHLC